MKKLLQYSFFAIMIFLMAACSSNKPKPSVPVSPTIHVNTSDYLDRNPCRLDKQQYALIKESLEWLGTPYSYAHDNKGRGTDCSGMVYRVYKDVLGMDLPRNSAKQAEVGESIKKRELCPCDLVFFATGSDHSRISHVGMMLTDNEFIHASSSKGVVISSLSSPYYERTFVCAIRIRR